MSKEKKQHTVYKNKNGEKLPSVTTVLGVMAKPLLVPWANKLGLQGINVKDYVDNLAEIGTLAHAFCEEYLTNEEFDKSIYSQEQITTAKICLSKFYDWVKKNNPQNAKCELVLISETLQYGGTCDCVCEIGDKKILLDFKTCKAIYPEMKTQVIAYKDLLSEKGILVDECRILRIGRNEEEGFEEVIINNEELHRQRFRVCLELYKLNKILNKD